METPTFCFSFTSEEFDIHHVNDALNARGRRLDGQQYPNAIHMAVTRPQTQPGIVETRTAAAAAVEHASTRRDEPAASASIDGAVPDLTAETTAVIDSFVESMLDAQQTVPPV